MKTQAVTALKWAGVVLITLGILYGALYLSASRGLQQAYAALEADGRPMKAEQIIPPKVPDIDNAALVYKTVVLQLESAKPVELDPSIKKAVHAADNLMSQLNDAAARAIGEKPDAEAINQFRQLSKTSAVSEALGAIEQASVKPGCRYDIDYTKGAGILLPHLLAQLRNLTRFLCATVCRLSADGDSAGAWRTAITSLRLSNALKNEPIIISQLVRIAQFSLTIDAINVIAASSAPSDKQYEEIDGLLKSFEESAPFVNSMDGERLLFGEWAFNLSGSVFRRSAGIDDSGIRSYVVMCTLFPPLHRRDHTAYLTVMHAYASNAIKPYSKHDITMGDEFISKVPRYCVFTRMLVPALSAIKSRYVSMIARARITRAGLAAIRYRHDKSVYPADLQALNLNDLIDPFTGKPLVYRTIPSGFVVYSAGENMVDDGGVKSNKRDIVWCYDTIVETAPTPAGNALKAAP